ncbi:MAG: preprotein translocase subunit SecG [Dehalococcoidia bacterium]|nr:preprotein translocase subunit SecG [Dehalococcoidia bacterium]
MDASLQITEILIAIVLIGVILLQVHGEGSGFFGTAESSGRVRRGVEKLLFQFTIVLVALFLLVSLLSARWNGTF